jgi:hypothetical protein
LDRWTGARSLKAGTAARGLRRWRLEEAARRRLAVLRRRWPAVWLRRRPVEAHRRPTADSIPSLARRYWLLRVIRLLLRVHRWLLWVEWLLVVAALLWPPARYEATAAIAIVVAVAAGIALIVAVAHIVAVPSTVALSASPAVRRSLVHDARARLRVAAAATLVPA